MPTNDIYIINPSYLKENTFIDNNVDEKFLNMSIKEAQEIKIRKTLGTALYNDVLSQIDTGTVTTDYKTLLDTYIIPALKYLSLVEAMPYIWARVSNKTVATRNSDNSTALDNINLEKFMSIITDKAQYYTERLILFLRANQNTYPLINQPGTGMDVIYPEIDAYECPIYFGKVIKLPGGIEVNQDRSVLYYRSE